MEDNLLPIEIYENLPDLLKTLTDTQTGRKKDILLLSCIGAISSCLPKVYGVYGGDKYYSNLYILIIAPPASGKGVMNKSKSLVEKIHSHIKDMSLSDIEDCKAANKKSKHSSEKCPDLSIKILPGNVSSSKVYRHLENSSHGLLILESEADTISTMLKQDWGNFSDVLRKAFHHETISISRDTDDKYFEVTFPKLSLVISGTPDQVKPLIQSKENGLYSRFLFYYFEEVDLWKDVSPNGTMLNNDDIFNNAGNDMFRIYEKLISNPTEINILLSSSQWDKLNNTMGDAVTIFKEVKQHDSIPIIKRHGVMIFRLCMILTIIRLKDEEVFDNSIMCNDTDFEIAISIIKFSVEHALKVSNLLSNKYDLTVKEALFMNNLPTNFERHEAVTIGLSISIPTRTIDYILSKWVKNKILRKVSNGNYSKGQN